MPPARSRPIDDSKNEPTSHPRERYTTNTSTNGRVKKNNNAVVKESGSALVNGTAGDGAHGNTIALNWSTTPTSLLHQYRLAYNLHTTAPSFHRNIAEAALIMPNGIGRQSPTMLKRNRRRKKSSREQLAMSVRKHFNDLAVNETEVVTEFLYTVRARDKALRQRFGQQKAK